MAYRKRCIHRRRSTERGKHEEVAQGMGCGLRSGADGIFVVRCALRIKLSTDSVNAQRFNSMSSSPDVTTCGSVRYVYSLGLLYEWEAKALGSTHIYIMVLHHRSDEYSLGTFWVNPWYGLGLNTQKGIHAGFHAHNSGDDHNTVEADPTDKKLTRPIPLQPTDDRTLDTLHIETGNTACSARPPHDACRSRTEVLTHGNTEVAPSIKAHLPILL